MRVLLVEDDRKLAEHLVTSFRSEGFQVDLRSSQSELADAVESAPAASVIVLDRLLGNYDSKSSVPDIRKRWSGVPILVLSAISTPNERAELLNGGADDYLGKPFSTLELVARVRALARRSGQTDRAYLQVGNLVVDVVKRLVSAGERIQTLPAKEFLLLKTLCQEPGRVWSRDQLLDAVWGQGFFTETNTVEATVANLRKRLHTIESTAQIRNSRNVGYWIEE